jgi:hypothetical protein
VWLVYFLQKPINLQPPRFPHFRSDKFIFSVSQPVIELYQTADHPALSPKSGGPEWRVAMAGEFVGFWITMWKTRQKHPQIDLAGGGGTLACGLVWLIFTTAIVF